MALRDLYLGAQSDPTGASNLNFIQAFADVIADDMEEYQEFDTDVNSLIRKSMLEAGKKIFKFPGTAFSFRYATSNIIILPNKAGPYDLPNDFSRLARKEDINNSSVTDSVQIFDDMGITLNRVTKKIYLNSPLSAGKTVPFVYIKSFITLTDIADWNDEINDALVSFTKYFLLRDTPDTLRESENYKNAGNEDTINAYNDLRKGHTLQQYRPLNSGIASFD